MIAELTCINGARITRSRVSLTLTITKAQRKISTSDMKLQIMRKVWSISPPQALEETSQAGSNEAVKLCAVGLGPPVCAHPKLSVRYGGTMSLVPSLGPWQLRRRYDGKHVYRRH